MRQYRGRFLTALLAAVSAPFALRSTAIAQVPATPSSPIGTIVSFAGPGPGRPDWEQTNGWLLCDGRSLNRRNAQYAALFNAIGSSWGGDGVNNFNVPDLRGRFVRGVDGGTRRDPDAGSRQQINGGGHTGDNVGTLQDDAYLSHNHAGSTINPATHDHGYREPGGSGGSGAPGGQGLIGARTQGATLTVSVAPDGGSETRPRNASVFWIIRYQ